ncbi:uncharacterized protein TNCT_538351 [Trichonephila clavata]|uniref:Uncharacterized protein n=1 Tax=Trichonephila clavata TaxID=2740835 RepID=A0A8X6GL44_TRICU|nr:uncharacterized protein TNCT_538351 [Trichonephila clavata]
MKYNLNSIAYECGRGLLSIISRDQGLCDDYTDCKMKLPEPLQDNFNKCIKNIYPDGSFGTCNEKQSLFQSSDKFSKYLNCILTGLPEKSSLDDAGKKQFDVYKKCLHKVGDKCMESQ